VWPFIRSPRHVCVGTRCPGCPGPGTSIGSADATFTTFLARLRRPANAPQIDARLNKCSIVCCKPAAAPRRGGILPAGDASVHARVRGIVGQLGGCDRARRAGPRDCTQPDASLVRTLPGVDVTPKRVGFLPIQLGEFACVFSRIWCAACEQFMAYPADALMLFFKPHEHQNHGDAR
jgi:hypothetical protein